VIVIQYFSIVHILGTTLLYRSSTTSMIKFFLVVKNLQNQQKFSPLKYVFMLNKPGTMQLMEREKLGI